MLIRERSTMQLELSYENEFSYTKYTFQLRLRMRKGIMFIRIRWQNNRISTHFLLSYDLPRGVMLF